MRTANESDAGKTATVFSTDERNAVEVVIIKIIDQKQQALVLWPNNRMTSIELRRLEIKGTYIHN